MRRVQLNCMRSLRLRNAQECSCKPATFVRYRSSLYRQTRAHGLQVQARGRACAAAHYGSNAAGEGARASGGAAGGGQQRKQPATAPASARGAWVFPVQRCLPRGGGRVHRRLSAAHGSEARQRPAGRSAAGMCSDRGARARRAAAPSGAGLAQRAAGRQLAGLLRRTFWAFNWSYRRLATSSSKLVGGGTSRTTGCFGLRGPQRASAAAGRPAAPGPTSSREPATHRSESIWIGLSLPRRPSSNPSPYVWSKYARMRASCSASIWNTSLLNCCRTCCPSAFSAPCRGGHHAATPSTGAELEAAAASLPRVDPDMVPEGGGLCSHRTGTSSARDDSKRRSREQAARRVS